MHTPVHTYTHMHTHTAWVHHMDTPTPAITRALTHRHAHARVVLHTHNAFSYLHISSHPFISTHAHAHTPVRPHTEPVGEPGYQVGAQRFLTRTRWGPPAPSRAHGHPWLRLQALCSCVHLEASNEVQPQSRQGCARARAGTSQAPGPFLSPPHQVGPCPCLARLSGSTSRQPSGAWLGLSLLAATSHSELGRRQL